MLGLARETEDLVRRLGEEVMIDEASNFGCDAEKGGL